MVLQKIIVKDKLNRIFLVGDKLKRIRKKFFL